MTGLAFTNGQLFTLGIELELQLVDLHHFNLVMEAQDFLRRLIESSHADVVKPEITQSMIELNSSVHLNHHELFKEVTTLKDILLIEADHTHIGICGGGTHPFQKWKEQRIFPTDRFASLSDQYGYLAKQFTVFGQHIHIGCENGDNALFLCHAIARYIPHFIALSASSPFHQGIDTAFDCSRLAAISAFPLSGTPPWILDWSQFEEYYHKMIDLGIITSMKDFYWDIRPKPEFGTVELRICDTPLTIQRAVDLAAYLQSLVAYLLDRRPQLSKDIYLSYLINRFRAARYGYDASLIDPLTQSNTPITDDIINLCEQLKPYAKSLACDDAIARIQTLARTHHNDTIWLRKQYKEMQSLNDVVRLQVEYWRK